MTERKARAHWNLHKDCYSIKGSGQPVTYAAAVTMRDCEFIIDPRLRARFEKRPQCRTVHALIKGIVESLDVTIIGGEQVRCNPFLFCSFVRGSDETKAMRAERVVLHPDKRIEAIGLVVDEAAQTHAQLAR